MSRGKTMNKQYTQASIEKSTEKNVDFIAVASTASEDRHGEVVSVDGWDIKNFKKNPVLLWAHDHYEMAVGKATKIWVEGEGKNARLMIKGVIHEATERARALKYLVQEGFISTMSVGFRALEMDGNTFTKQELLEVSFVNVPANSQAMISAYKSLSDAGFEKKTITELGIPVDVLDKLDSLTKTVEELQTVVKVQQSTAPPTQSALRTNQAMLKVIARASDKLLGQNLSKPEQRDLVKVIKKVNEKLITSHKKEL